SCLAIFFSSLCVFSVPLSSFPTRRSSDLSSFETKLQHVVSPVGPPAPTLVTKPDPTSGRSGKMGVMSPPENRARFIKDRFITMRSEEHTSELQSRSDLVCRLLLEKKNSCR